MFWWFSGIFFNYFSSFHFNKAHPASFLNTCLQLFDHKQKFCAVITCSTKQIIEYITWAENNGLQYGLGVWHKSNPAPLCNYKYLNDVEYWIYIKGNKSKILGNYHSKSLVYKSQINKKDKNGSRYDRKNKKNFAGRGR